MSGSFTLPSTEKELSEVFKLETTTVEELEFTSVTLEFAEFPTLTEPKSIASGTAVKDPWDGVVEVSLEPRLLPHPVSAAASERLKNAPMNRPDLVRKSRFECEAEEARADALSDEALLAVVIVSWRVLVTHVSNVNFNF